MHITKRTLSIDSSSTDITLIFTVQRIEYLEISQDKGMTIDISLNGNMVCINFYPIHEKILRKLC